MATLLGWKVFSALFGVLFLLYFINLYVAILPVTGLTFVLSCIFLWIASISIALFGLHKLMQCKDPISSEFLNRMILETDHVKSGEPKLNKENLKKLVTDIDKYFISKWFCNISSDQSFTEESRAFIEESLERLICTQLQVSNKRLLLGICNIYLKHLKEFRRTLKRKEKYGNVDIQELYRYAHVYSNTATNRPRDYYILQLTTTVLKHFINSELWNSLPCSILIAVLARKFTTYILDMLSNPEIINYCLLISLVPDSVAEKLSLTQYSRISLRKHIVDSSLSKIESLDLNKKDEVLNQLEYTCEVDTFHTNIENKEKENKCQNSFKTNLEPTSKSEVILRKRKPLNMQSEKNKNIDPVKIYEPKSSTKTWRDTRDLACVSLGQDPLLEGTHLSPPNSASKIGAKFWEVGVKAEECKNEDSPTTNLFNEMVNMTSIEGLRSSIKPILSDATERTLHNIKDIQESTETTVHNALHKIGDFQVIDRSEVEHLTHFNKRELSNLKYPIYLPPHTLLHSSVMGSHTQRLPLAEQSKDEAVGVVEGILDFGRAGFRKGLKLTGLQDNIETAKASISQAVSNNPKAKEKPKLAKASTTVEIKSSSVDSAKSVEESCWINPLQNELSNYDCQMSDKVIKLEEMLIPSISTEHAHSGTNSPDPEYEDAADLASSIAKLRSLLQQRSSESSLSTPALSPMPDEYKQMESETASDVEVDGVMPSFYKFCTKTASGVLNNTINTLKTALPNNNNEHAVSLDTWMFKTDFKDSDVLIRMRKLLTERKEYCVLDKEIDNAYEAIDSIDFCQTSPVIPSLLFEDELDEFELKIPLIKTLIDIFCELMADTNSAFVQEPIIKIFLLIFGNPVEKLIETKIEAFRKYFAEHLVTIPEKSNTEVLDMEFGEYIDVVLSSLPGTAKIFLSEESLKSSLNLLVSSLQTKKINQDTLLQVFELVALRLIEESTTPPVSA